ncbi:MAG TPA: hypothetical protein VFV99_00410 [Kofleriaceae bacterium]|nr:hypothetical protein [Kofleriaceae bacterium]
MDLDLDMYWCAVKGAVSPVELVPRLYGPHATVRAPTADETVLGRTDGERKKRVASWFTKGEWTFFLSPRDIFSVEKQLPECEVLTLHCDARNEWTSIAHWVNGVSDWSAYGSDEDEWVRVEGELPASVAKYGSMTEPDRVSVPIKIGAELTGFRHDKHARPRGFQIVDIQPPRTLIQVDGTSVTNPTLSQVEAAVETYLTAAAPLVLTVGDGEAAATLTTRRVDEKVHSIEHQQRSHRSVARVSWGKRPIDALDVRRCFRTFYDEGETSDHCSWSPVA